MKIIYVESSASRFWSHRRELARAALKLGYEVHVVAPFGDKVEEITTEGFIFHRCDELVDASLGLFGNFTVVKRLVSLYESISPSLVHHFDLRQCFYGTQAACELSIPRVINTVGSYAELNSSGSLIQKMKVKSLLKRCCDLFNRSCSTMIVQNRKQFEFWTKNGNVNLDKIVIVRGGVIDTDKFRESPDPDGVCSFIYVGRLLWNKGVGDLVEAAKLLKSKKMNFKVDLYGPLMLKDPSGIPEKILNDWIEEGVVNWHESVEDMLAVYESSNVLVIPTHHESISKSLLEAASCGRAIIATDIAGCRDVVTNKVNGVLVPANNHTALATAMTHMIKSPEVRTEYGKAARERIIKEFSNDAYIENTLELYKA